MAVPYKRTSFTFHVTIHSIRQIQIFPAFNNWKYLYLEMTSLLQVCYYVLFQCVGIK